MYDFIDEKSRRHSQNAVWITQVLFGLILSQGLILYREIILSPFDNNNLLATFGLFLIFITTILSWIDFSQTMDICPYLFNKRKEKIRFLIDVFIIILYSYLLFSIKYLIPQKNQPPKTDISRFIIGFSLIYFSYMLGGIQRRLTYGYKASRLKLIIKFLILYILIFFSYIFLYDVLDNSLLNFISISILLILVLIYRELRRIEKEKIKKIKNQGFKIGVDVDGTLANQIDFVLDESNKKYGLKLKYEDIDEWNFKIGDTNIATLIEEHQSNDDYILGMKTHPGCANVIRKLGKANNVIIITARQKESDKKTQKWLFENKIFYDDYVNSRGNGKSDFNLDILIDDYHENIDKFLVKPTTQAILIKQPWNMKHVNQLKIKYSERLILADSWDDINQIVIKLKK